MPVKHGIWRIGDNPQALQQTKLQSEQQLEEMIVCDPAILSSEWMLIGRQEQTRFGGRIDLLAIAPDGSLILIELKRDRTPREIVAQALDYASWVQNLDAEDLASIYRRFSDQDTLDAAFRAHFGQQLDEDSLNSSHQVVIVAAELDDSTERIVTYLNERDIAINVLFFRVFEDSGGQLLSRVWLIDPSETQANAISSSKESRAKEPWNGEFYVSYGPPDRRSWEDARQFGFISAGGGSWYSQTLKLLSPGDRVWVNIPKTGYVGVGRVIESICSIDKFTVSVDGSEQPILNVLQGKQRYSKEAEDPETREYFVRIQWLDTVPQEQAFAEVGLFGNQNTVCQPRTPKWRHTVERLKVRFSEWGS